MPFALIWGVVHAMLVLPVVGAVWLAARGRLPGWRRSECFLLALLTLPCVVLAEMLALGFLPMDRPLRLLLPWVHLGVLGAIGVWMVARRESLVREASGAGARLGRLWRAGDPWFRVAMAATAVAMIASFAYSAWNAADEHDGALYRMVIVMQPWQDGRIGHVTHPGHAFTDAYPRTIELLYSWTVLCTGNTVGVLLVNWYGLVVLAAAAYVVARRAGLTRRWACSVAALAATTPLPMYLTCVLYDDVPVGGWLTAALAMGLRPRKRPWGLADLGAFSLALGLATSAKFSAVPPGAIIALGVMAASMRLSGGSSTVRPWAVIAGVAAAAGVASLQYLRSWLLFGSPLWPLRVAVGGRVLFEGPMRSDLLYTVAQGPWAVRWSTSLYKLFQTTSQDANGSYGLLFAIGVVPGAAAALILALRRPRSARPNTWLLLALFLSAFLVPAGTVLRYSLYMLAPGYTLFIMVVQRVRIAGVRALLPAIVTAFLLVNIVDWGRSIAKELTQQIRGGVSLLNPERNRDWYLQFAWIWPGIDASMYGVVHSHVHQGERMVYAVNCLPGLLYDHAYSYAIEYRSVASWADRKAPPDVATATDAQVRSWLRSLQEDGIDAVLVRAGSVEDVALAGPGSAFVPDYQGSPIGNQPAANIYRRGTRS